MINNSDILAVPPAGLIDLHCHLVPGVDDGPQSETEAFQMLRIAEDDGIEIIAATPHLFSTHNVFPDAEETVKRRDFFLKRTRQDSGSVEVLLGAEVYFTTNLLSYLKEFQCLITLNAGSYFILEFPFDFVFPNIKDFIYRVMLEGWIPIISHVERNRVFQRNPGMVYKLVKMGALSQVNAGSLRGDFGEAAMETALKLIAHNLVHVIASDAHSPRQRTPTLSFVYSLLKGEEREKVDLMVRDIPRAIIEDQGIPDIGSPTNPEKGKSKKIFDLLKRFGFSDE
jgi:protein-tyrosine phosphatase